MSVTLYSNDSRGWLLIVGCLCLCVMVQMLGVPVTLLSPSGTSDLLESSLMEGLSVLPRVPDLLPPGSFTLAPGYLFAVHVPAIASALFHPPVR